MVFLFGARYAPSVRLGKFTRADRPGMHRVAGAELLGHSCEFAQVVVPHRVRVGHPPFALTRLATATGAVALFVRGRVLVAIFLGVGVTRSTFHGGRIVSLYRQRACTAAAEEVPRRVRGKDHQQQAEQEGREGHGHESKELVVRQRHLFFAL